MLIMYIWTFKLSWVMRIPNHVLGIHMECFSAHLIVLLDAIACTVSTFPAARPYGDAVGGISIIDWPGVELLRASESTGI